MAHIKTESSGEGTNRAVTVKYIAGPADAKPQEAAAPIAPTVEAPKAEEKPAEETAPAEKVGE
jgi:hypothetical protein